MNNNIFPLKVYVFVDEEGHHYGYNVVHSEKELAVAIVANQNNKLVTDYLDLPVFNTFGMFVDRVFEPYDYWFRTKFLNVLIKAQRKVEGGK